MREMTFNEVVIYCAGEKDLVSEFNRLTSSKLGIDNRSPIETMVDQATGYDPSEKDIIKFMNFVYQVVWLPLIKVSL